MFGRVAMGWFADHVGVSTTTLALASVAFALSTIRSGWCTPDWPLWALLLLAAVAGVCGVRLERRADRRDGAALAARHWSARPRPAR